MDTPHSPHSWISLGGTRVVAKYCHFHPLLRITGLQVLLQINVVYLSQECQDSKKNWECWHSKSFILHRRRLRLKEVAMFLQSRDVVKPSLHKGLEWHFSNINVKTNHLGTLWKCRFWYSKSGGGSDSLHFLPVPRWCWCYYTLSVTLLLFPLPLWIAVLHSQRDEECVRIWQVSM